MQRSPGTYTAGTIQGTAGQPVIIGVGTAWATTDATGAVSYQVAALDGLMMPGQRTLDILSVDGVGQLTLNEPLPFGIPAGSSYTIIRRTPVVSSAVLGAVQQLLNLGSDANPDEGRTFDNGVSRLKIDFDDSGKIRFRVGATGADGSTQHPYELALLIDPGTGNVTATGLTGIGGGSGALMPTVGKPSNAIGLPGAFALDGTAGVLYGPKSSNNVWPAGLSLVGPANDPTELNNAVTGAAGSAALSAAWASTADDTDVPGAPAGSRSARNYADKAGASATAAAGSASAAATSAIAAAASAAVMANDGKCRLVLNNAGSVILLPFEGGTVIVNGQTLQIPSSGIVANLPSGTGVLNFYLYGTTAAPAIDINTAGYVVDGYGRKLKAGEPDKRWVGSAQIVNGQSFDDATRRYVLSAFNRQFKTARSSSSGLTTASSSSPAQVGPQIGILCDGTEPVFVNMILRGYLDRAGLIYGVIGMNGAGQRFIDQTIQAANQEVNLSISAPIDVAAGTVPLLPMGQVSSGAQGTYSADFSVTARM